MQAKHLILLFLFMLLYLSGGSAAWSAKRCAVEPSFDCSKIENGVEKLICTDNELAELDNQLAGVYQTALNNFPPDERETLKSKQRSWVTTRNACQTGNDLHSCVRFAYESRITELQIQGGMLSVPEPVTYKCDSGKYDYLQVVFYTQTVLPAVVLTGNTDRDNWQETAFSVPSGSGAKYQGAGILFWSKGKEALLERQNRTITCVEMK